MRLGAYDPSGKHAVPGLFPDLYGRHRLNVGVYVPETNRTGQPLGTRINGYNYHLRWGLGDILPGGFDR